MGIFTSKIFLQISMAIHSESNLNQSEPIWNLEFLQFSDYQSETNMKAIWNQYEIWKFNLTLNSREKSILHNLKLNWKEKLIGHNMKLKSRGIFVAAACLSASIRAKSSSEAWSLDLTSLSFLTLIASALTCRSAPTLTASPETYLYSSIMVLSTYANCYDSSLTLSILVALVLHGLFWVSNHIKI